MVAGITSGLYRKSWLKRWLSLALAFLMAFLLTVNLGMAQEEAPQPPEPWQIRGIFAALDDPDPEIWIKALEQLNTFDLENVEERTEKSEKIIGLIEQEPENTILFTEGAEATYKLGNMPKDYPNKLVQLIAEDKSSYSAASALGNIGEAAKESVPDLIALLQDDDSNVRYSAASALGNIGEVAKESVPDLILLLTDKDDDPNVLYSAAQALGNIGEAAQEAVPDLIALLQDNDSDIRIHAAEALGNIGKTVKKSLLVTDLIALLQNDNPNVRSSAARALGAMGNAAQESVPVLIALLQDNDSGVRYRAIEALGRIDQLTKEAIPVLITLLEDNDPNVGYLASLAFGGMGDSAKKEAIPVLITLLQDDDYQMRFRAARALRSIGEMAMEATPTLINLLKEDFIRSEAALGLGGIGEKAKEAAPILIALLQDDVDSDDAPYFRSSAVQALWEIGAIAEESVPILITLLQDDDSSARYYADRALSLFGTVEFSSISEMLDLVYRSERDNVAIRWLTYYLSNADPQILTALQWLGQPKTYPDLNELSHDEQVSILKTFEQAWQNSEGLTRLRSDLAKQTAVVINGGNWKAGDIALLQKHYQYLKKANSTQAAAVQEKIRNLEFWQWVFRLWKIWLAHIAFWIGLIFSYPKYPPIQAIFFWNPWVRKIAGVGYVGFLLTWVPFLRAKLFEPFKTSLLADADLVSFRDRTYFPESTVQNLATDKIRPITKAIPELKGQIILQGESGLGKSQFLRHLSQDSSRIMVFLPAERCEVGVIKAIQTKLHGDIATDENFLRNLIYSGALDICIDGLNEVSAETRAEIRDFVERNFKGNIILTTQPLEWRAPATSSTYVLQPLNKRQIKDFLLTREAFLSSEALVTGDDYREACRDYLEKTLNPDQSTEELKAARQILSNPMDLTLVAQMIADHEQPDLFNLQAQQYKLMAADYKKRHLEDFPLAAFSEAVYQMRLADQRVIPEDQFYEELLTMERFKMVVSQQFQDDEGNATKEWKFRHDKIMEYFIVQTFLKNGDRPEKHLDDPRFRGVYQLLAFLLPLQDAQLLRETLIDYAVDTKDHHVSDLFIQRLRSRQAV